MSHTIAIILSMIITLLWIIGGGTTIIILMGLLSWLHLYITAEHIGAWSPEKLAGPYDAIMMHSYCPGKESEHLPYRGRLLIFTAYALSKRFKCPIILTVGKTVPGSPLSESEIYKNYLQRIDNDCPIILGRDSRARDTWGETIEAYRRAQESGCKRLLILGTRPHLARIVRIWKQVNKEKKLCLYFLGVYTPLYYYIQETMAWYAEKMLPPGSRRRNTVLNILGRHG